MKGAHKAAGEGRERQGVREGAWTTAVRSGVQYRLKYIVWGSCCKGSWEWDGKEQKGVGSFLFFPI